MTTDTMRWKFEQSYIGDKQRVSGTYRLGDGSILTPGDYLYIETRMAWRAYKQGQRDLIEAMGDPIGHVYRAYDGSVQIELIGDPHISDGMLLYRLPEDTPK